MIIIYHRQIEWQCEYQNLEVIFRILSNAIRVSYEESEHPLFIARAKMEGTWTSKQLSPEHKRAYIPYGGKKLTSKLSRISNQRCGIPGFLTTKTLNDSTKSYLFLIKAQASIKHLLEPHLMVPCFLSFCDRLRPITVASI